VPYHTIGKANVATAVIKGAIHRRGSNDWKHSWLLKIPTAWPRVRAPACVLSQELGVGTQHGREVLVYRGDARCGIDRAHPKLASVPDEKALDRRCALGHVEVGVNLAALWGSTFGGASGLRHHDGQAACDCLGDPEPKGLIGARVNEHVGARERARELRSILFEASEVNSRRRAGLESAPLGSVAK
jgi:hypothetical protein